MSKNALRLTLAAAALFASAPAVHAGKVTDHPVNIAGKSVSGSMETARNSADTEQYIGCSLKYRGDIDQTEVSCVARDKFEKSLGCASTKPEFVPVASGITDYAWIYFECDGPELVSLTAAKYSHHLP
ncbi:MAG: hypothetical protein ABW221_17205 [Vicinamibacteria bacterium]